MNKQPSSTNKLHIGIGVMFFACLIAWVLYSRSLNQSVVEQGNVEQEEIGQVEVFESAVDQKVNTPVAPENVRTDESPIKSVILVPLPKEASWQDFAYLAAVPASAHINNGRPVVLALDEFGTMRPETKDFLARYKPESTYMIDGLTEPSRPTSGILQWWPMDEGKGFSLTSKLGSHTGEIHRLPTWKAGRNDSHVFDGQCVSVTESSMPGASRELTVAFWMKADKVDHQSVVSKDEDGDRTPGWRVMLRDQNEGNSLRFRIGGGGDAWHFSDLSIDKAYEVGEWVHVTCTHADRTSKVYLNGHLKGTREGITWATPDNGSSPLTIAHDFQGAIDELRIYNRALDESEVKRLLAEVGKTGNGLVGYWPMDLIKEGLTPDLINRNHLQIMGKPTQTQGRLGEAIHLKDPEEKMLIPSNSPTLKPFTIAFDFTPNAEQDCIILSKRGTADQMPPWSFSMEQSTLVFRVGDKGCEIRAKDLCPPKKSAFVKAAFDGRKIALRINDTTVESNNDTNWSISTDPPSGPRYNGILDNVQLYDKIVWNKLTLETRNEYAKTSKNLIASWSLDPENSLVASSCWAIGKEGHGLQFNQNGLYVECTPPPANSDELTVAFWVKPSTGGCLLSRQPHNKNDPGWHISLDDDRRCLIFEVDGQSRRLTHPEAFHFNQWTHFVCIYDADGNLTLYINGRWAQTLRDKDGARVKQISSPLLMGALVPGHNEFNGTLDDVIIYERAISENEARALHAISMSENKVLSIEAEDAERSACALARKFWKSANYAVCCSTDDYGDALVASALAGRLKAPLFFFNKDGYSTETQDAIRDLKVEQLLLVGHSPPILSKDKATILRDHHEVLEWMEGNHLPVKYLAAVNPQDRAIGLVRKTSLAGPLLAAGRQGATAVLDFGTQWKLEFDGKKHDNKVADAPDSKAGWQLGTIELNGKHYPFVLTACDHSSYNQVSLQTDEGKYDSPLGASDTLRMDDRDYTISFNRDKLQLTWPDQKEIRDRLGACYRSLGHHPEYLCILGRPDVIPHALVQDSWRKHGTLQSDIPFAEADSDLFSEIAVGRIVAEDVWGATLLASRSIVYEDLADTSWTQHCATAGWEEFMDEQFANVGFNATLHHKDKKSLDDASPLRNVAAIVHGEHCSSQEIANLAWWYSDVLVSPLILDTSGCSVMDLSADPDGRSAPVRLLRNGATAVFGNTDLGIAEGKIYATELWNALLEGMSTGQAHRYATNRAWLRIALEGDGTGKFLYQIHIRILFGDPAMRMHLPGQPKIKPATTSLDGDIATVTAPAEWWSYQQPVGKEWGYTKSPTLLLLRGYGIGFEERWDHQNRYNATTAYYTAEIRSSQPIDKVEQLDTPPTPLGWSGRFSIDEHQDGSRSILWRVRLIDFDQAEHQIRSEAKAIRYKLAQQKD